MSATYQHDPLLGISQRLQPQNSQAEQALLGAILANNAAFNRVAGFLKPEHFADPIHARIYEQCARMILRGQLADAVTLKTVFENTGILEEVGGTVYLAQLLTAMVGILNAGEYGSAIYDSWLRRRLIELGTTIVEDGFGADPDRTGEEIVQAAADALMDLTGQAAREAPAISIGDAARAAITRLEQRRLGKGTPVLTTGVRAIDDAIGGLEDSLLYILGGRPGMGKSSLAIQIAVAAARQLKREQEAAAAFSGAGGVVVLYTLEMRATQVAWWATCHIAGLANDTLRHRDLTPGEARCLIQAQAELDSLPMLLIDAVGMSGPAIALRTRALSQRNRVRLVIADHLGKVVSDQKGERGETSSMSKVTSGQKNLANQLGCPVLWLAQLSRDVDRRDDPRPRLSDLMYAGEADADVAFFLFREERYLKKHPPEKFAKETEEQYAKRREAWNKKWDAARGRAELIVAKRREGAESVVTLGFDGKTTSFYAPGMGDELPMDRWDDGNA